MGLTSAFSAALHGNFNDAMNYAFVDEATIEASNAADTALKELNRQEMIDGKISQQEFERRSAAIDQNAFPSETVAGQLFNQPGTSPWTGFKEGAIEGLQAESSFVNKTIGGSLDFVAKAIPWELWLLLAIYLAVILVPRLLPKQP